MSCTMVRWRAWTKYKRKRDAPARWSSPSAARHWPTRSGCWISGKLIIILQYLYQLWTNHNHKQSADHWLFFNPISKFDFTLVCAFWEILCRLQYDIITMLDYDHNGKYLITWSSSSVLDCHRTWVQSSTAPRSPPTDTPPGAPGWWGGCIFFWVVLVFFFWRGGRHLAVSLFSLPFTFKIIIIRDNQ